MHYQRTDPWVDFDQWVISQRLHKANLVDDNRRENFISGCSCCLGEKKQRKIQEVCSFRLGDRKAGFNKTSVLFLTSHWGKKCFGEKEISMFCNIVCWKERWNRHSIMSHVAQAGDLYFWVLSFLIYKTRDSCPPHKFCKDLMKKYQKCSIMLGI